jgi:hypothetical protein
MLLTKLNLMESMCFLPIIKKVAELTKERIISRIRWEVKTRMAAKP